MDIDKLQRINTLARELMKHGMAGSMDEAVRMAEEKINGAPEVSRIKEAMSDDMISQTQVSQSSDNLAPKEKDAIELKKLKSALDSQSDMINSMAGKINEMVTEFNKLNQEINRLKTIQVPSTPAVQEKKTQKGTQTQFRPQAEEKKEGHARSGNYNSNDVSVEKIFYSGSR